MNHLRNIREMLNITTEDRNVSTGSYFSLSDSQMFSGSQFWPENSQGTSQDMSKSSKQNSQEDSDPKYSSNYSAKPLLFGDPRDKTLGFLDAFDEEKKKAKEKSDSQVFAEECLHIRETLNKIEQLVSGTEKNTSMCQIVLEKITNLSLTAQSSLSGLHSDISHRFEVLFEKLNFQRETMGDIDIKIQESKNASIDLGQKVESLKSSMENLKKDQVQEQKKLEEVLKLLTTLVSDLSAKPSKVVMVDTAVQKSPGVDNKLQISPQTFTSNNHEHSEIQNVPQGSHASVPKRRSLKATRKRKKRPLVLWHRKNHSVSDENSQPVVTLSMESPPQSDQNNLNKEGKTDGLPGSRGTKAVGCFITPLSCWSPDSDHSVSVLGIDSITDRLPDQSQTGSQLRPESFWHLFDADSEIGF